MGGNVLQKRLKLGQDGCETSWGQNVYGAKSPGADAANAGVAICVSQKHKITHNQGIFYVETPWYNLYQTEWEKYPGVYV